ncbi:transcription-repair coupling factor [Desulfobulbus rhabdoformis]|uniref:transcription-repair coupling factor n=1 Tax=Desulfobulbus rhabdoformis TaxID=34032 RepID=UPI0019624850|nr:transcription-repair coupling factor [Desulfobulbus rhabdoformis]MBM9615575.1 transcription-repair coupling factor [Desulfobulbus rhabdoformis]
MQSILARLRQRGPFFDINGLHGSSTALLLSRAVEELKTTICCILPADEQLELLAQDLAFFTSSRVLIYPSYEIPPYTPLSPDPATVCQRLATLYQIQEDDTPCILLTSVEAILRRVLPSSALKNNCELVIANEEIDREELINALTASGYQLCDMVRQEGDMALRGGIIDVFPPGLDGEQSGPLRLDFFGDTVESIRVFDPISQRSKENIEEVVLLPATELLFPHKDKRPELLELLQHKSDQCQWTSQATRSLRERLTTGQRFPGIEFFLPLLYGGSEQLHTLFDYLSKDSLLFMADPAAVSRKVALVRERTQANYHEAVEQQKLALPPDELFVTDTQYEEIMGKRLDARFSLLPDPAGGVETFTVDCSDHGLLAQEIELQRKKRGLLGPLADRIVEWQEKNEAIVLACRSLRQSEHLRELLAHYHLESILKPSPYATPQKAEAGVIHCFEQPLSRGFDLNGEGVHFLSASELFGEKRLRSGRRRRKRRHEGEAVQVEQLAEGDIVVHRDHGIGMFKGMVNMEISGQRGDFLLLGYKGEDKLYVPVDRLHWVSRYQGLTDQEPKLDSLGSQKWQSTKKKVSEAVWKVAQELLEIYAKREMRRGHRFSPPGDLYRELEESFPYDETSGQAKAIDDVIDDLTHEQPMDRLICGDVGYGKTEVAARAAFKAIEDGFQVAILVPTTVLAEQHAATFRERFASFPVEIACLNRFRTSKQQKEIVGKLKTGAIDLVVGTHRLLSKDIVMHKLGLLIVDEEHRFGVAHKEKIKKFKANVDVLTLTATPIPRTLQMSLLGIRDLSVISSPPQQRRAVKTFLAKHDQLVIREAVIREMERGGQLFFVHNRVQSIYRVAENIGQLVPHARIGVAHGQMAGPELEDVMVRFINHELDILVCTTIVESGLDIPNANTIIINRADYLGLADIYQLRGRVGRSNRQAYAYLLVASLDHLTPDAQQRLRALMDCSELGGGFKLAMNDLQIRGGGNLLGVSQSGHIAAVGYDLYLELLQSTVADLKRRAQEGESSSPTDQLDPEVQLKVSAYLPDSFIRDTTLRYQAYRRISMAGFGTEEELVDIERELEDRFGVLPREATTLLEIIRLKQQCRSLGIEKLEQAPQAIVFSFIDQAPVDPSKLLALIQQKPSKKKAAPPIRLTPDQRLVVPCQPMENVFERAYSIINALQGDQ